LISANYQGSRFGELTENRTLASLPYGGRYRLIDFALSNMTNSGITTVGVIAPYNAGSLIDHISAGSPWSLNRKSGGLFLMTGSVYGVRTSGNRFLLRDLYENKSFFERDDADYVILTSSSDVYNIDFQPLIKYHSESGKPLTMVYKKIHKGEDRTGFFLTLDDDGKVTDITTNGTGWSNYFMDCFIVDRKFMIDFLSWFKTLEHLDVFDIARNNLELLNIGSYEFKGYLGKINTSKDFLKVNQDMCDYDIRNEVFCDPERTIRTKVQDEAPAYFLPGSEVRNSIVSAGCRIEGRVENSIIFRTVNIGKGAVVRNSIIMMHGDIGENAVIDNVVCDKYVTISDGVKIYGGDEDSPIIIGKNSTL
jgi:glucose-1-phosphate adenylyltransferase